MNDGTIVILADREEGINDQLNFFILVKNNEIFVDLLRKEGDTTIEDYGKVQMNYEFTIDEVIPKIIEVLDLHGTKVEKGFIQLYRSEGGKLPWKSEHIGFRDLIIDSNQIHFEILPFHLQELVDNVIIKVQHYKKDNTEGELYVDKVPNNFNVWKLLKYLAETYLMDIDGSCPSKPEDVSTIAKKYILSLVDRDTKTLIRIFNYQESLAKDVLPLVNTKNSILRINYISPIEQQMLFKGSNLSYNVGILFCMCVD